MRNVYAPTSTMPCALPWARDDFTCNSSSSGLMNASKKSRNRPLACFTISRMSSCKSVLNTTGRKPSASAVALILRTASSALSTVEINGKVTCRNACPSNCVSKLWPIVSAVTPVWSDTKQTVRLSIRLSCSLAQGHRYDRLRATSALFEQNSCMENLEPSVSSDHRVDQEDIL